MVAEGITLGSIRFSMGEPVLIGELADANNGQAVDFLREDGFTSYRRSAKPVARMGIEAVTTCLADSAVEPEAIDAVIFSTESFADFGETNPFTLRDRFLKALASECGIARASVHASWLNECANLPYTLNLAAGLVASGSGRNVLVVVGDRLAYDQPRVMANGAAVMSDGAACALVRRGSGGYALRHVVTQFAPDVFAAEQCGDVQRKTAAMMTALADFASRIEWVTGRRPADYPLILTDNLHSMYLDFIGDGLGISAHQTRQPSKGDAAHLFALDSLLGLTALASSTGLPLGEPIALLNVIPWSYGFIVLEAL